MSNCALHSTVECLRLSCIHARGVAASGCLVVLVHGDGDRPGWLEGNNRCSDHAC